MPSTHRNLSEVWTAVQQANFLWWDQLRLLRRRNNSNCPQPKQLGLREQQQKQSVNQNNTYEPN